MDLSLSTYKMKKRIMLFFIYTLLIFFMIIFIVPFYYVFVLATRDNDTIYDMPPPMTFGTNLKLNIQILFKKIPFLLNFSNSVIVTVVHTITRLFFCTLGGFAMAKYKFKGKNIYFYAALIVLMVPKFFNLIPMFKMMVWFKWTNTYYPLIIPGMADAFGIFLMTQFLSSSIPSQLLDAGRIDGLNEFQLFLHIGVPLAKPALFILGTISAIFAWNDFLWPYLILTTKSAWTLPVALSNFSFDVQGEYGAMLSGTALSIVPMLVAFLMFSKGILNNLLAGSLKQ